MTHLDRVFLDELAELMEDEFPTLMQVFLNESQAQHQRLQLACLDSDFAAIQTNAHSLKGSSGNIGAFKLHALCADLEAAAKAASADDFTSMLLPITHGLTEVHAELEALLTSSSGP